MSDLEYVMRNFKRFLATLYFRSEGNINEVAIKLADELLEDLD